MATNVGNQANESHSGRHPFRAVGGLLRRAVDWVQRTVGQGLARRPTDTAAGPPIGLVAARIPHMLQASERLASWPSLLPTRGTDPHPGRPAPRRWSAGRAVGFSQVIAHRQAYTDQHPMGLHLPLALARLPRPAAFLWQQWDAGKPGKGRTPLSPRLGRGIGRGETAPPAEKAAVPSRMLRRVAARMAGLSTSTHGVRGQRPGTVSLAGTNRAPLSLTSRSALAPPSARPEAPSEVLPARGVRWPAAGQERLPSLARGEEGSPITVARSAAYPFTPDRARGYGPRLSTLIPREGEVPSASPVPATSSGYLPQQQVDSLRHRTPISEGRRVPPRGAMPFAGASSSRQRHAPSRESRHLIPPIGTSFTGVLGAASWAGAGTPSPRQEAMPSQPIGTRPGHRGQLSGRAPAHLARSQPTAIGPHHIGSVGGFGWRAPGHTPALIGQPAQSTATAGSITPLVRAVHREAIVVPASLASHVAVPSGAPVGPVARHQPPGVRAVRSVTSRALPAVSGDWSPRPHRSGAPLQGSADRTPGLETIAPTWPAAVQLHQSRAAPAVRGGTVPTPPFPRRNAIGEGAPLEPRLRDIARRSIGVSLDRAGSHAEPAAAISATTLRTHARTAGSHTFFGRERTMFRPPSEFSLLAHELTHAAQHQAIGSPIPSSALQAQSRKREASGNALALGRVLARTAGPIGLSTDSPGPAGEGGDTRRSGPAAPRPEPPPLALPSAPITQVDRAPVDSQRSAPPSESETQTPQARPRERETLSALEVDAVARQVYDWIVQRLTVERERAGYP